MKFQFFLYSLFLILFGLCITFLVLVSSHQIEAEFLFIHLSSIIIFLFTIYFLNKTINGNRGQNNLTVLTLIFTGIIFIYYSQDLLMNIKSLKDLNWFTFLPILGLGGTLYFIFSITKRRNA